MCGIAGYFHPDRGGAADAAILHQMCEAILHRGPDHEAMVVDGGFALGMRRLAILDLETGDQPFFNAKRTAAITFNGEIYNYQELKEDLLGKGYSFKSAGDTEVLIHLYDEYGVDMLKKLNGMFAFAIADFEKDQVFLARDRLGIKPLFLTRAGGAFLWGSEIKAILQHPAVVREVDRHVLPDYLYLNYMPPGRTLFAGIEQLLPGEYAVLSARGVERREYWDLKFQPDHRLDEQSAIEESLRLFEDAVRMRLVSDVPFGAFLSGGIDSSAVVAYMARHLDAPVKTFSIGFGEKSFDETPWARRVAEQFGTEHHELRINPNEIDLASILPKLVWHSEEPTADSSAIPVLMVSELARQHVKMVLSGDGGDELFAGYPTYNAWWVRERYRRVPGALRRGMIRPMVDALPVSSKKISFDFKARRFVRGAEMGADQAHFFWRHIFSEEAKGDLLTGPPDTVGTYGRWKHWFDRAPSADDPLSRMLYFDTRYYLPGDMLVKVDRMSMATSLEARVPFLDHRLAEFAATIPSELKFKGKVQKYLLKKGLEPILGKELLYRKKAGFNIPKNQWLRGPLLPLVQDTLSTERLQKHGLLNADVVQQMIREHVDVKADHSFQIWSLLIFQLWYDRFIDGVPTPNGVHHLVGGSA